MIVSPSGMMMLVSDVHPRKALDSMVDTEAGMMMPFNDVQSLNVRWLIFVKLLGKVMFWRLEHPSNA